MTGDRALCERDALGNWLTVKTTLLPLGYSITSATNIIATVCVPLCLLITVDTTVHHCVFCTPVPSYNS